MKQLLVLSGKGGTGKTTITSALIRLFKTELFADCDVDAPNLHLLNAKDTEPKRTDFQGMDKARIHHSLCSECGMCIDVCRFDAIQEKEGAYHVNQYACEGCAVCWAVCPSKAIEMRSATAGELMLYDEGVCFSTDKLKMGSGTSGKLVSEVKKQLKGYEGSSDWALIDGSPGIGCPVIASVSGVDMVLVVTEPTLSGYSDMMRIIKTAQHFNTKTAVCINKYDINDGITEQIKAYCQEASIPFVGTLPYDSMVPRLLNQGKNILDEPCSAGLHIKEIYKKTKVLMASE